MALLGMGILLSLLYFILIYVVGKSAVEKASGGTNAGTELIAAVLLFTALVVMFVVLGTYGTSALCFWGCKKSAEESLAILGEKSGVPQGANASVVMGDVSHYDPQKGPVYAQKPDTKPNTKLQEVPAKPPMGVAPVNMNAAYSNPQQPPAIPIMGSKPQASMPVKQPVPQPAAPQISQAASPPKASKTGVKKFKAGPK